MSNSKYHGWKIESTSSGGWIGRREGIDLDDHHPVWLTPQEVRDWIDDFETDAFTECADALASILAQGIKDAGPFYPNQMTIAKARAALDTARALGFLTIRRGAA